MPTDIDLEGIKARCEKATRAPWTAETPACLYRGVWAESGETDVLWDIPRNEDDEEFIAHARQDVPALVARVEELERERDHFARRYDEMCGAIGKAGADRDRLAAELAEARALVEQTERRLLSSNERWQEAVNEAGELRAERDAAIARAGELERELDQFRLDHYQHAIERATVEAIATWIDETADKWCAKHGGTMAGAADSLAKSIRSGAWRKERGGE